MSTAFERLAIPERAPTAADIAQRPACWKLLSVEDDPTYQASLLYSLGNLEYDGIPVEILTAGSAAEAASQLSAHPDIAVVLLDVVMDEDDSGLRLVNTIRERLGNHRIRIILLTGQPGMAPRNDVMRQYDIDDYWQKADLKADQLITLITGNLRTWIYITELERARQGLQLLVEASRALTSKRDLKSFSHTLLEQIGNIIGADEGGIVSAVSNESESLAEAEVMASSGCYSGQASKVPGLIDDSAIHTDIGNARAEKRHIFRDSYSVLYFGNAEIDPREYVTVVKSDTRPSRYHISLLQVFAEQVSGGFANIALNNRLSELAYYDDLLNIPNRNWLVWEMKRLSRQERARLQLTLIDLDRFSDVTVTLGTAFSDKLIEQMYSQLTEKLEDYISIARTGLDSFAILGHRDTAPTDATIRSLIGQPLTIDGAEHSLSITASSLPLSELDHLQPREILRIAECCIDTARQKHLTFLEYSAGFDEEIRQRYALMNDLRLALAQRALHIELQPKVSLSDNRLIGFEALARWEREDGSRVRPDQFIPLAETAGLISELDQLVVELTCEAIKQLNAAGIDVPVAFNASSDELFDPDYFDTLIGTLKKYGVRPEQMNLEITESRAMESYEKIAPQLKRLIEMGMAVSIDDFGTGYSSLSHITHLAATTLKIDQVFVRQIGESPQAAQVVEMILRISERFGLNAVAEGVETLEQRDLLLAKGCRAGQGYLYSRPQRLEVLIDKLASNTVFTLPTPDEQG
ncbi:putative bifunctional diguanylate cyclase/phosphodiesterase [Marinobacterium lutimaris]|uniref:EAL domain, c-di-GMP-specific phosphodiesterase class I (Or its enzymatically inactive variant) n=1 Tax=Marinobacterium lutimaris TaxID=568106 RepID=A0A1H6DF80_9GAMM|nr:EAL domain-containing protein [Marinobacterium lutimaris]SEG83884.1 EAL domain, c-di-GMP-specific phosphodiesterase class I (or its enzymatically inactive variant) [Marinobacterium lutimaris]